MTEKQCLTKIVLLAPISSLNRWLSEVFLAISPGPEAVLNGEISGGNGGRADRCSQINDAPVNPEIA
jgi:hypothetical protein